MKINPNQIRSAASPGERRTLEHLAETEQTAVRSTQHACGCVTHTRDDGTTSTFIHEGAPTGHQPAGKTTDVTRSAHSRQRAVRNAPERPKTVTRSKSVPLTDAQSRSVTQSEIKRINAKGDNKTLTDVKYLRTLHARAEKLNNEQRVRADADVKRAAEKFRARRALRPETIDPTQNNTAAELRVAALGALERESYRLSPADADHFEELIRSSDEDRNAVKLSQMLLVTESDAYHSLFQKSLLPKPLFTPAEGEALRRYREIYRDEIRAAAESGTFGLAIPFTLDPTIQAAGQERAPIVAAATQKVVTTNAYKGVASVGSSFSIVAEGAVIADDSPTLTGPSIPLYSGKAFIPYSLEVGADFPSFIDEFSNALSRGWVDLLGNLSAAGTGSSQPTGIFQAMQNSTTSPSHVTVTTSGALGYLDIRKAWQALPERYKPAASWVMHEDVLGKIRNEAGAASQIDVTVDRLGTTIMGRPVITTSYAPDFTGTTGSENFLAVGDLSSFTVVQRSGMIVEVIPALRATTGLPLGESGLLAVARVGMDVSVPPGLRLLSNS